jgi:membrane protein insertase Oxa1/YidC/SpoIIIJ
MEGMVSKDLGNIPQGISSYGISEYVVFCEDTFTELWMTLSTTGDMGLGYSLILSALIARGIFTPLQLYQQVIGQKMKMLMPDIQEHRSAMMTYMKQGNKEAAKIER